MNILQAIDDPQVFGNHFPDRKSWRAWRAFLAVLFGLPLRPSQRKTFQQCTGRTRPRPNGSTETWLVCGRRAGKSFILALIAVFLACFRDWRPYLGPGERATVTVIAADRKQARVILRYVKGLLHASPMLAKTIEREVSSQIDLSNQVTIEVHTASFRTVRGYTIVAALCDEIAFWRDEESRNPDTEVLAALRPTMATIPGAMLLCASSPYARRGALWRTYNKKYGKNSRVLVWQAPTRTMNPNVPQSVIDEAYQDDPASAAAEYGAQFRSDVESFVPLEVVQACVVARRYELPPAKGIHYFAFTDPSGGSKDSMTLAIAHRQEDRTVVDALRECKPPFSPDNVVQEFAQVLQSYGIGTVTGDHYGGMWPRERFQVHGVEYQLADKPKSDLYRDLLPLLNSERVELLDHKRLVHQLVGLDRRTGRSGKDSIDHASGGHDDIANVVAGVVGLAGRPRVVPRIRSLYGDTKENPTQQRRIRLGQETDGRWLEGLR